MHKTIPLTLGLILAACVPAVCQTPAPAIGGAVNAASYITPVTPGSIIAIFGSNLATGGQTAQASSAPLPTTLAGTTVSVNGIAAPLLLVSPRQINAQVPAAIPSTSSPIFPTPVAASVVVSNSAGSSAAAMVQVFNGGLASSPPIPAGAGRPWL